MSPIRILLVDDHALVRAGIRSLLQNVQGVEVVAESEDGRGALELVRTHRPDVVLMDIAMPVMDGIEATKAIREEIPGTRVVVLTGSAANLDISRARSAGASAYVTKDQIAGDLVRAILEAAAA